MIRPDPSNQDLPATAGADVIIVGAGPAGAVAALLLARSGRRVTLVERERFPRAKPCGDCLSAAATALLDRLGLLERVMAASPARLDGWRLLSPAGHACGGSFDGATALALERRRLDTLLLDAAHEAGARLVHGRVHDLIREDLGGARVAGVRVRPVAGAGPTKSRELRAPLVVGADGLRSVVARRLGAVRRPPRLRKISLTTHGTGPAGEQGAGEMHVLDRACFGLAPVGDGRFNLTLVVAGDCAPELRRLGPARFFAAWLDRAPAVRERIADATLEKPFLASGPFDCPTRSPVAPGAALVGDAAGYYDPFTGQGVYQAMEGARRLAWALDRVDIRDPAALDTALAAYARELRRLKRPARLLQRVVEAALARPRRADRVIRRLGRAPAVMDRLVQVTGDLRPVRDLLSPALLSTFLIPSSPEVP